MEERSADLEARPRRPTSRTSSRRRRWTSSRPRGAQYVDPSRPSSSPPRTPVTSPRFSQVQSEVLQPLLQIIADDLEVEGVAQSEQAAAAQRRGRRRGAGGDHAAPRDLPRHRWSSRACSRCSSSAGIARTVRSVQRTAEAMAAGDLTVRHRRAVHRRARPHGRRAGRRPGEPARGAQRRRLVRRRGGRVVGGAVGVVGADLRLGAGDQRPVRRGRRCRGGGLAQRADRGRGRRADGCLDPGDRRRTRPRPARSRPGPSSRPRRRRRRWPSWASPRPRSATW